MHNNAKDRVAKVACVPALAVACLRLCGPGILVFLAAWFSGLAVAGDNTIHFNQQTKVHLASLPAIETPANLALELPDNQVTIVTFFASWCPPCLDEFHSLNAVKEQFGSAVSIVAVNAFEAFDAKDEGRMQRFLANTNPAFPLLESSPETLELFGNVNRIPTLYVFDQSGQQTFNFIHARGATKRSADTEQLIRAIRPLL